MDTVGVLKEYYTKDYAACFTTPQWDLRSNLPRFYNGHPPVESTRRTFKIDSRRDEVPPDDIITYFFDWIAENILDRLLGITPESIRHFFSTGKDIPRDQLTVGNIARDMLVCDYESVQLCS
eukprot:CAMPEP_0172002764 /NCGR_PEP_ID=MMETSP1041-20130122/3581_1 /TAXON_ID=464988 /ORGANISM="Hemiselmis andersenii, Strain CCMP439" /LENGTH=121 /DNA_ID=CAMNT_0012656501 /DNA_START=256 /DNA_END=621 /DNA_ORIENTATION=-